MSFMNELQDLSEARKYGGTIHGWAIIADDDIERNDKPRSFDVGNIIGVYSVASSARAAVSENRRKDEMGLIWKSIIQPTQYCVVEYDHKDDKVINDFYDFLGVSTKDKLEDAIAEIIQKLGKTTFHGGISYVKV